LKQKYERRIVAFSFIIIQTILYGWFLVLDFSDTNRNLSNSIKFVVIVLCFCYVLFYNRNNNKSSFYYKPTAISGNLICLRVALFFTIISDLFILLLDYYLYGVLTFIIVQQLYGIKIDIEEEPKDLRVNKEFLQVLLPRIGIQIFVTAIICILLNGKGFILEKLLIITVFYFISLVTNVFRAVKLAFYGKKECSNWLFAIGMILFLLCDISVGLFNLSEYVTLYDEMNVILYSISSILMWTFYAPSQVLIALSAKSNKINKNN